MTDAQTDDELAVFTRFLTASGVPIDPSQFQKRPAPEPDILFTDKAGNQTA